MANQKAAGITARISVDTVDARSSVNMLKRSVRQLNTRFKDTYQSQLMAGHAEDALRTKNQGAKEQYDALTDSIRKVRDAIQRANEAGETGTKNYHQTQLDLQNLVEWRKRENYTIEHTNHLLILHNDALRSTIQSARHNKEVGKELLEQYKSEGNVLAANNRKITNRQERLQDLNLVAKEYANTIDKAKAAGIANTSNPEFNGVVEGLHQVKVARSQLKEEIALDDSKLKSINAEANNSREIHQDMIRTYESENRSIAANVEKVNDLREKLRQLNAIENRIKRDRNTATKHGYGNSSYVTNLTKKLYRVKAAAASANSKLNDLSSGLSTGKQYNDLYNQSLNTVVSGLKNLKMNAQAGREEYRLLHANINNEGRALDAQREKLQRVAEVNKTANDSTGKLSIAYQRERAKYVSMNATIDQHLRRIGKLNSSYGAMSKESAAAIDRLSEHIRTNDHAAHNYLRTAHALTNGGIALGAAFYYGAKKATTLEHEFNKIGVLAKNSDENANKVNRNVRSMGNEAVNLSETYGVSQTKISNGFENLIRRGYSSGQALSSMKYYLKAATASGEDLSDVIDTAGSTIEGFDLRNQHLGKNTKVVTNEMAAAADYTASSFHDMGYAMSYTGSIAHGTGQSISQTASALGVLSNNSIKGSMAGTSLRRILGNLASFKSNNKILKGMGLGPKDFQTSKGNLKSLSDIMSTFQSKMNGMSKTQQTNIMTSLFGRDAENAARVLTNNADSIGSLNSKVAQAAKNGYTSKTSRQNMKTTEGQLLRLREAGTQMSKEYAEGVMPVFGKTADAAMGLANGLSYLPKSFKTMVAGATLVVPAFGLAAYAISAVRKVTSVYLGLKRYGLTLFSKSDEELKINAGYYDKHRSQVDSDTAALKSNNQQIQRSIELANEQNGNLTKNATATDNNTKSKQDNSVANENNAKSESSNTASLSNNSIAEQKDSTVMGRVRNHTPIKSGLALGAITGGTEMLSGNTGRGAEDGVGTAAGTIGGGALGAAISASGGPIGGMIGSVAGPLIARSIGNALNHPYHVGKNLSSQTGEDRSVTDSLRNDLKHINGTSQNFIRNEARLNAKAATQFATNGNKVTNGLRQTAMTMYQVAKNYGERQLQSENNTLKAAAKNHQISNQQVAKAEQNLQSSESSLVSKVSNYNSKAIDGTHLTASQRVSLLDKANSAEVRLTSASGNKQEKLLSDLNHRTAKLNTKSYSTILSQANSNYKTTRKSANSHYATEISSAKNTYGLLERAGVLHHKSASKSVASLESLYGSQRDDTISKARKTSSNVSSAASNMADNTTKKHYQASKSVSNANSSMASNNARVASENSSSWSKFMSYVGGATQDAIHGIFTGIGQVASAVKSMPKGIPKKYNPEGKKNSYDNSNMAASPYGFASGTSDTQHVIVDNPLFRGMSSYANGSYDVTGMHFAAGVLPGLQRKQNAIINDGGGRELVKLPNGHLILPKGRNVHTILPKGTSVFNANQTRQLLGQRRQSVHFANGTMGDISTGSDSKQNAINVKTPDGGLKKTEKSTKKSMSNIHDLIKKGYKKTGKDAGDLLDKMHDKSSDIWDNSRDLTKDHMKDIHDDTIKRSKDLKESLDSTQTNSNRLTNDHLGTMVSYFKHHFSMIPPISRTSMKSGINNINSGIGAIDKVLGQFGGNSHVLGAVHYDTGTSGPSMQKQLAILNDATSGPQQEAVVSDQGRVRIPRGRNVPTMLNPGDKVLNGSDTLRAFKTGLIPHYASGLKSTDALRDLAKHYAKAPTSFTNNTFNKLASVVGNVLSKGITQISKTGAQTPANRWSSAMWQYIDSLIDPDNSVLVKKMHELGDGKKYKWGATGPSAYDCSGLVHSALSALGIGSPRTSGPLVNAFQSISKDEAGPGDLVGNSEHIGVVDSNGAKSYFSAFSPGAHPNILSQPLNSAHFTPGTPYHFARIPQLAKYNNEEQRVKSNPLTSLVKRQLGHAASNWIYKNIGDAGMSNPAGDGVGRWRSMVVKALNALNLSTGNSTVDRVLRQISTESGGNPNAVGGTDGLNDGHAMGLMQVKPGTFSAYGKSSLGKWNNGYASIYAGLNYAKNRYGSSLSNLGNGHGYANGGLSKWAKQVSISEGNRPEMVLPLTNKSRAVELIMKSLQYMFGNEQKSSNQTQQPNSNSDRQFERELIQSNKQKDFEINKLVNTTNNILNKMTVLINTVRNKPTLSQADVYKANRNETLKKARLRNFNRGTF